MRDIKHDESKWQVASVAKTSDEQQQEVKAKWQPILRKKNGTIDLDGCSFLCLEGNVPSSIPNEMSPKTLNLNLIQKKIYNPPPPCPFKNWN